MQNVCRRDAAAEPPGMDLRRFWISKPPSQRDLADNGDLKEARTPYGIKPHFGMTYTPYRL